MNDLISRQAAIDALETTGYDFSDSELSEIELEEVCEAVGDVRQDMINRIKLLSPAQPEPCDAISRQEAIRIVSGYCHPANVAKELAKLPSAQQEEAIPVAWLEEQVKWFESMDNAFAKIEANNIRVMIKKWRSKDGGR